MIRGLALQVEAQRAVPARVDHERRPPEAVHSRVSELVEAAVAEGMTRRDFLNGVAISLGGTLTSAPMVWAQESYPPALTGMRGSTDASYAAAHALRDGQAFPFENLPSAGDVDLLVVGAGISGLAAAYFYRQRHPRARILILDNHDDFGGHARRCEMRVGKRLLITYGGSESIQSPYSLWSEPALSLLRELGIDLQYLETAFDRTLYPNLGLSRGLLFKREAFGIDKLVTGDPTRLVADDIPPEHLHARPIRAFIEGFPLDAKARAALVALYQERRDFWPRDSIARKIERLASLSYHAFLTKHWGLTQGAARVFHMRPHHFYALGSDLLPAFVAASSGYPGFQGLGLPIHPSDAAKLEEPYIYHFPDGNASLARLLVRKLLPGVAPGNSMHDIVLAPFDYTKLDADPRTQLRLESTVLSLRNVRGCVDVGYIERNRLRRLQAKRVVYAGYHAMLPYIMRELSERQRMALSRSVKAPIVYVKVALRNWEPWAEAGVHDVHNTIGFYSRLKLDYPVSMGGYRFAKTPRDPIVAHLVHVPVTAGHRDQRAAWQAGRQRLQSSPYREFERHAFDELSRILGSRFDPERDVAGITVFRWGHGYAYGFNSLFDSDEELSLQDVARVPVGRVAIANSDAAWSAYAHAAIDEAARAVDELSRLA